jgi:hypothetical protein
MNITGWPLGENDLIEAYEEYIKILYRKINDISKTENYLDSKFTKETMKARKNIEDIKKKLKNG